MTENKELETCIARIATGDQAAFAALYDACSRSMFAYAVSVLHAPERADDVVQDAFLKIWRAAPSYDAHGKPMAWILRITRNLCLDELRRSVPEPLEEVADRADPSDSGAQVVDREYVRALLDGELTDEERDIVRLRIYADLPHNEIAEAMGLSTAAVRWKYTYALKKLRRRCLADERAV